MPKVYLSASVQEKNLYAGGLGNEEGHMQAVADRVAKFLVSRGVTVYLNDPRWRLEQIVEDSNSKQPDIHLAIHSNAGGGHGCEVFAYDRGGDSEKLAKAIYTEMEPLTPTTDRGVKYNPTLYELRKTKAPAALVEVAYHDNLEDARWIHENIEGIAQAIARGVLSYFDIADREEDIPLPVAMGLLHSKGIVQSPDYWLEHARPGKTIRGEYAALLIKRVALFLKGRNLA